MSIKDIIKERRSIRAFKDSAISKTALMEILEAGLYAPTACNLQLMEYIVITDKALKDQLVKRANASTRIKGAPVAILILYDKRYHGAPNYNFIQSASASIENMLLRATELGLGSLWIGDVGTPSIVNEIVKAPDFLMPVAFVLLGLPSEAPPQPIRRPLESLIHWNTFADKAVHFPSSCNPKNWSVIQYSEFQKRHIRFGSRFSSTSEESRVLAEMLKEYVGGLTLDLLSSPGTHLYNLGESLESMVFYEQSYEIVRFINNRLSKKGLHPSGIVGQGSRLPFREGSFDRVICYCKMEQYPGPYQLLVEARRVLKRGGLLLLVSRNLLSYRGLLGQLNRWIRDDAESVLRYHGPLRLHSSRELIRNVRKVGLNIRKTVGVTDSKKAESWRKHFCRLIFIECQKT